MMDSTLASISFIARYPLVTCKALLPFDRPRYRCGSRCSSRGRNIIFIIKSLQLNYHPQEDPHKYVFDAKLALGRHGQIVGHRRVARQEFFAPEFGGPLVTYLAKASVPKVADHTTVGHATPAPNTSPVRLSIQLDRRTGMARRNSTVSLE